MATDRLSLGSSSAEILQNFINRLPEIDWENAEPERCTKAIEYLKQYGHLDDRMIGAITEALRLDELDLRLLLEMDRDGIYNSFLWRSLKTMGLGSNIASGRTWELYPTDGFFGDYLEYTLNSEGPLDFHFFAAATILGAACKRNFLLRMGHVKVWPNLWAVLVAPSGICRKTSTCLISKDLVDHLPAFNSITNTSTPEFLVQQLAGAGDMDPEYDPATGILDFHRTASQGFICAPELGVFLGKQQYNEGMIQRLTELSDNPDHWTAGTRKDGVSELHNVALSLLGAITPDWLRDAVPRAAHGGGFMSRILWIYKENTDRRLPFPPPPSPLLQARLVRHLRLVTEAEPAILRPTDETMYWFSDWYNRLYADTPEDRRVSGYLERKPTNVLRLAGLLTLAQTHHIVQEVGGHRECIVPLENVQAALAILDGVEEPLTKAVSIVDSKPGADDLDRIRRVLRRLTIGGTRPVMRSDLMRRLSNYMSARELDVHLSTLIQSLEVERDELPRAGKTVIYYRMGPQFKGGPVGTRSGS